MSSSLSLISPTPPAPLVSSIPVELAGERIDKVLARLFPDYSRSCLQRWLKTGRVRVNNLLPTSVREPACAAATVVIQPDWLPEQCSFIAEPVPLDIVYEDPALVVVNKPDGCVVHPATGHWQHTILNGLLYRYREAAASLPRAGIVHRLDKGTSGLMVVARTLTAQTHLIRQLQARTVKRGYLALVWGIPQDAGTIDAPIGRASHDRLRMTAGPYSTHPRLARTHYQTVSIGHTATGHPVAAVRAQLETGRTHQIRVHFAHIGHPLIGDPLYGKTRKQRITDKASAQAAELVCRAGSDTAQIIGKGKDANNFTRQALHALQLELIHPLTGNPCAWSVPIPDDLAALAEALALTL